MPEETINKIAFDVGCFRACRKMFDHLLCADIHHIDPMFKCADPQKTIIYKKPMYISVGDGILCAIGLKLSYSAGLRVDLADTCIFCTNPDITVLVLADFPHGPAADAGECIIGEEFLKKSIGGRPIIYAAKITASPYTPFTILAQCI